VGIVDRAKIINGSTIVPGDVLVGLRSAGLHTNGYSLARRVLFDVAGFGPETRLPELEMSVGDALLAPHRSYLSAVRPLLAGNRVKGLAHITGGGITENLPRVLPSGCGARIDRGAWSVPPFFRLIQDRGAVAGDEMFRAFNMGIGLIVVCAADDADDVIAALVAAGEPSPVRLGVVTAGEGTVSYSGAS
jgi:phosphoribosylformylglycinamidine cyclo-ligase